ncbi:serine O-acetyltransferase [Methylocella silvestris]|uniref:serine O-acetyltransferase n=1 Tax=Methylocella silvestris TaxID=199596 RepID=UPI001FE17C2F|nr:serine acetyltransferase [Methylocella silvestris]
MVYRLAHARRGCKMPVLAFCWKILNLCLQKMVEVATGITLPEYATIGRRLNIEHFGGIIIHGATVIGDDCVLRQGVTLGNKRNDQPLDAPILGDRVEVGAGAKILGRVRIGNDALIGANAVVLCDVPAGATAVGVPARIVERAAAPVLADLEEMRDARF